MSDMSVRSLAGSRPSLALHLDRVCTAFEVALRDGGRPRIEDFLGGSQEPDQSALICELVLLDLAYRRRRGERAAAGEYEARFPAQVAHIRTAFAEAERSLAAASTAGGAASAGSERSGPLGSAGRNELFEEIGRGGMGRVLRGRDSELGRDLAVKVLHEEHRANPNLERRFIEEAQIGGQLQHPGIVPVYELGYFPDKRPFFAMKLVRGRTLADLLKERTDSRHDQARYLAIFEQVCQAVAYAHSKGVVHRDLKPANVMLGAFGEVQVMDWGLAKVLADRGNADPEVAATGSLTLAARSGSTVEADGPTGVVGTPAFMAPEQARGETALVDERADVFGLGGMLCVILTGQPPYTGSDRADTLRQAAAGDMAATFSRLERCGADAELVALCKGCLAPQPGDRPPHAGAVAAEMAAHQATMLERLRKAEVDGAAAAAKAAEESKRRRVTLVLAGAVAATLLAGTAISIWQAVRATSAEQSAVAAAGLENQAKEDAVARETETKAVLGFVVSKVFAAARPEGQKGGLGYDVKLADAVKTALPFVEENFKDQPLIEARLRMTLGLSFLYLDEAKIAVEQFEKARATYVELRGPNHPDTLESMNNLANCYFVLHRLSDALMLYEETLALRKVNLPPNHPDTLMSMNNLANCYAALKQFADARQLFLETLQLRKAVLGADHVDTLLSMNNFARIELALGRSAEALDLFKETLRLRIIKLPPAHPDILLTMQGLANCYAALHRHAEALELRKRTVALQTAKIGADHSDTLMSKHDLASSYMDLRQYSEALDLLEELLPKRKVKIGPDNPETLLSMSLMAECLVALNRGAEAVPIIDDCCRLAAGKDVDPQMIPTVMNLRLRHFEKTRDAAACRATAEMWEKFNRSDAGSLYTAACYRAVTAGVARTLDTDATRPVDTDAERAMLWLRQSIAKGYRDIPHLLADADLAPLRGRADYADLLWDLADMPTATATP